MTLTFLLTWAAALVSPGPDLLLTLRLATTSSRPRAIAAALGIVTGIAMWVLLAIAGVGALLAAWPSLMSVLLTAGGAFLVWMGASGVGSWLRARVGTLRTAVDRPGHAGPPGPGAAGADATAATAENDADAGHRPARAFAAGLATNAANPKALVFFGALFTRFLPEDAGVGTYAMLIAVMLAMATAWFVFVAVAASHPAVLRRIRRVTAIIDAVAAVLFIVIGGVMLAEGLAGLAGPAGTPA